MHSPDYTLIEHNTYTFYLFFKRHQVLMKIDVLPSSIQII